MGSRGNGGGHRGARHRGQAAQIWLVPTVDGIDRVIDGPVHHRQVDHGERRRLAEARGSRRSAALPMALTALMFQSSTGFACSAAATDAIGISPTTPTSEITDRPASQRRTSGCGPGSVHGVPPSPVNGRAAGSAAAGFSALTLYGVQRRQIVQTLSRARHASVAAHIRYSLYLDACPTGWDEFEDLFAS